MRKSIKDYSITELSELDYTLDKLPIEVNINIRVDGEEMSIYDYIQRRTDEFFKVPDDAFKNAVGKVYVNKDFDIVFKVVGYNHHAPYEFYYEQYERRGTEWVPKESIWLERGGNEWLKPYYTEPGALEALEKWENDPNVDMNIGAEGMYLLGEDGNMYADYSCGGDYFVFTPVDDNGAIFSLIKASVKNETV